MLAGIRPSALAFSRSSGIFILLSPVAVFLVFRRLVVLGPYPRDQSLPSRQSGAHRPRPENTTEECGRFGENMDCREDDDDKRGSADSLGGETRGIDGNPHVKGTHLGDAERDWPPLRFAASLRPIQAGVGGDYQKSMRLREAPTCQGSGKPSHFEEQAVCRKGFSKSIMLRFREVRHGKPTQNGCGERDTDTDASRLVASADWETVARCCAPKAKRSK